MELVKCNQIKELSKNKLLDDVSYLEVSICGSELLQTADVRISTNTIWSVLKERFKNLCLTIRIKKMKLEVVKKGDNKKWLEGKENGILWTNFRIYL